LFILIKTKVGCHQKPIIGLKRRSGGSPRVFDEKTTGRRVFGGKGGPSGRHLLARTDPGRGPLFRSRRKARGPSTDAFSGSSGPSTGLEGARALLRQDAYINDRQDSSDSQVVGTCCLNKSAEMALKYVTIAVVALICVEALSALSLAKVSPASRVLRRSSGNLRQLVEHLRPPERHRRSVVVIVTLRQRWGSIDKT
jgi:hypothetical protein